MNLLRKKMKIYRRRQAADRARTAGAGVGDTRLVRAAAKQGVPDARGEAREGRHQLRRYVHICLLVVVVCFVKRVHLILYFVATLDDRRRPIERALQRRCCWRRNCRSARAYCSLGSWTCSSRCVRYSCLCVEKHGLFMCLCGILSSSCASK